MPSVQDADRSAVSTWWMLALVVSIACWMNFGTLHHFQSADSVLPVLVSLQHWTPFYWGQDRFGMLVPLLAMPFRDPLANLLLQGCVTTTAALVAPFLVLRYFDSGPYWFAAGAFANALLLLLVSPMLRFDWLVTQPYGLSISLAFAGLLAARRSGRLGGFTAAGLLLLAHWVNLGIVLMLVPCVAIRGRLQPRELLAAAIGFTGGVLFAHRSSAPATTTATVPFAGWPTGWLRLLHSSLASLQHPFLLASLLALLAIGVAAVLTRRTSSNAPPIRTSMMAFAAAVVYWLVVGTLEHVRLNDYFPRYVFPSLLLAGIAASIVIVSLVRTIRYASMLAAAAFAAAAVFGYGTPSVAGLNKAIDRQMGSMTRDIVANGATVIAGDYWTVWPAVFHASLVRYRSGAAAPTFGLTYRSGPTDALWSQISRTRRVIIAASRSDRAVESSLAGAGVPVTFVGYTGSLALYAAGPHVGARR